MTEWRGFRVYPSNEIERAILCKLGTGCNQEDLHLEALELKNTEHTVEHLKSIINSEFEEPSHKECSETDYWPIMSVINITVSMYATKRSCAWMILV